MNKTLARCALLTAIALILSLLENCIPIPLPGVKLGLANAVTLYLLLYHRPWEAFAVLIARLLLAALFSANPSSLLYAAAGGLLALLGCWTIKRLFPRGLSPIGLSMAGAALHHVGQLACALWITASPAVLQYLPWLLLCAIPSGAVTGLVCLMVYQRIKNHS